jgi:hypothetical protein
MALYHCENLNDLSRMILHAWKIGNQRHSSVVNRSTKLYQNDLAMAALFIALCDMYQ